MLLDGGIELDEQLNNLDSGETCFFLWLEVVDSIESFISFKSSLQSIGFVMTGQLVRVRFSLHAALVFLFNGQVLIDLSQA